MNYEFKVGDVGLLRDGVTKYTIVAIVEGMTRPIIVRKDNSEEIVQRYTDGRFSKHADSRTDLMPPPKIVYDVYYEYVEGWSTNGHVSTTMTYDNIEQAKKTYDKYSNRTDAFKNVKLTPREVQPE